MSRRAVFLCAAVAVALRIAEENLPQKEQERFETIIALVAVGMITWMVVWMRRHSADLKGDLQKRAEVALVEGSALGLVIMAFLAVLREGLETSVFLLAAFQQSDRPGLTGTGAALGIVVAVILGYLIYRGGVKLNLSRVFRFTGVVLVLVAAGLLAFAVHTGHEAGWINVLLDRAVDLRWLIEPGSVQSALITGMFGIQPEPTVGEVLVWFAYAIPMTIYVLRPQRRPSRRRHHRPRRRAPSNPSDPRTLTQTKEGTPMSRRIGRAVTIAALSCTTVAVGLASPATAAKSTTVKVVIDDDGCPAKLSTKAGPTTFKVSNEGSGDVSEFEVLSGDRIIGEVENIAPGLNGEFSLTLKAGDYTTACPGGSKHAKGKLAVTGTAATKLNAEQKAAVETYRAYLVDQSAQLVTATKAFTDAVDSGNVELAKQLYPAARVPYERIEPVAETFGDLDPDIDAREGDVPKKEWGGFHVIEQALWVDGSTSGLPSGLTAKLNEDVQLLANLVKDVEMQPASIANGSVELLNEVSSSKITGEEERYSRTDLVDFEANVQGSQAAFDSVKPLLTGAKNTALATQIDTRFAAVTAALVPYRSGTTFVAYTELTTADTKALSQAIDSLAEPLSKVAKQVVST